MAGATALSVAFRHPRAVKEIGALILALLVACSPSPALDHTAPATFHLEPGGYEVARVTRIVDGDTVEVEIEEVAEGPGAGRVVAGGVHDVRLVGIDTPESVDPRSEVECFGREASAAAGALLAGQRVRLVKDVEDVDSFGRLLRYVYIGDEMANARLVVNGYATAYTYPPNVRHAGLFVALQREARESDRGLWAPATCNGRS